MLVKLILIHLSYYDYLSLIHILVIITFIDLPGHYYDSADITRDCIDVGGGSVW